MKPIHGVQVHEAARYGVGEGYAFGEGGFVGWGEEVEEGGGFRSGGRESVSPFSDRA